MDTRITRFTSLAKRRPSKTAPYPESSKAVAVDYDTERIGAGEPTRDIARRLGIAPATLEVWTTLASR